MRLHLNWLASIGLVALAAGGLWRNVRDERDHRQCLSNLKNIHAELEIYSCDHAGQYPDRLERLTSPGLLATLPVCPAAGYPTYSYNVGPLGPKEECAQFLWEKCPGDIVIRLRCEGQHHPSFPNPSYTR